MISFSRLGKNGRLGNQLFQIASMVGLSRTNGCELALPNWKYARYLKGPFPAGELAKKEVHEPSFSYSGNFIPQDGNDYDVHGYLQSEKYWQHCREEVRSMFSWNQSFLESVRSKNAAVLSNTTVALHIRRGDYVNHEGYVQLPALYYLRALEERIPGWRDMNLLFFSDDVDYVKLHYGCLENAFFPDGDEVEHLCLMTQCDHFVIANSSFSWWGAYLGEKPDSVVVRPQRHFSGSLRSNSTADLYPERWIALNELSDKLQARDITFVIPISYDHPDRYDNLRMVVDQISDNFNTNFSFIEQGGRKFGEFTPISFFGGMKFHRTRMLNMAIKECGTKYAANYDCDVMLPPAQILKTLDLLRNGFDIVYPYNGTYWHVLRSPGYKLLRKALDVGVLAGREYRKTINSRGGAVFMNVKTFFGAGGENENFISHGPEDSERFVRFRKLGLKIGFVDGNIFHVEHWRGKNSHSDGHSDGANNVREYEKVVAMSEQELRDYVKTWTWAKFQS